MTSSKFCVFCGCRPQGKTKEHIIPRWLIELTGDPSREAYFGFSKNFDADPKHRKYAFDQFTFPACNKCNNKYSSLEAQVNPVLKNILADRPIPAYQVSLFLDWLDKVRVGLWLGMMQLDNNSAFVDPKFHIETRIGQSDRLLIVEKSNGFDKRLNFGGADTYSFSMTPSAFVLIVNNYYFTNISYAFLFSGRLGFPFPQNKTISPDHDRIDCDFLAGNKRIMKPLIRRTIFEKGIRIFQPMFGYGLVGDSVKPYYESDYVRTHSMNYETGRGNIFEENVSLKEYHEHDLINLTPLYIHDDCEQFIKSAINIHTWQNWLSSGLPDMRRLSPDQKKFIRSRFRTGKRINDILIKHHQKLLQKHLDSNLTV